MLLTLCLEVSKMNETILSVKDLRISFKTNSGLVKAARGISFDLKKDEILAIVGESGSGKSVTSKAILGVLENNKIIEQGQIIYKGEDLLRINEKTYNRLRGSDIAIIYQDTMSTLNPIMRVGQQVLESLIKKEKKLKQENREFIKATLFLSKGELKALAHDDVDTYLSAHQESLDKCNAYLKEVNVQYQKLKEDITNLENQFFADEEGFDFDSAYKAYKHIYKRYKNLLVIISNTIDYSSSSYLSLIKSLFTSMKQSFKDVNQREKLFSKYKDSNHDYYSLPKKIKAHNKEEITEPICFYTRIKEELNNLIGKISSLNIKPYKLEAYKSLLNKVKNSLIVINQKIDKTTLKDKVITLLKEVGIEEAEVVYNQYPFELSGGMRQRIAIIIAVAMEPKVLVCDEPTTSLDVTIQEQILDLIQEVKTKNHLSVIFVTHDLGVVSKIADEVVVMYAGKVLEKGTVFDIFYDPRHPHTWSLLSAIPENNSDENFIAIKGNVPNMIVPLKGDAFAYRSDYAVKQDMISFPDEYVISSTHVVYSHLYHQFANGVRAPEIVINRIRESLKTNPINIPKYRVKKNSIIEILKKEGTI